MYSANVTAAASLKAHNMYVYITAAALRSARSLEGNLYSARSFMSCDNFCGVGRVQGHLVRVITVETLVLYRRLLFTRLS